jgi:hypothetical protein
VSTTGRDLLRRLWLLLALGAAVTVALFGAYRGVHSAAVPLASSSASGVLELDTAKYALLQAQSGAAADAASDGAGTGDFHTQISVANQSLAAAAADDVTGPSGRLALRTVISLISVYGGWIELAAQVPESSLLHAAYMHFAQNGLGTADAHTSDASVMGRLNELQHEQLKVVDRQTSFGWPLWLGWSLTAALGLALLAALAETQRFLRARFRRRWNRWLVAAGALLVAGLALPAVFTWQTHTGLFHSRTTLRRPLSGVAISGAGAHVARLMADTGLRAAATDWILAGGALLMALVAAGLMPRVNEYRFRTSR